MAPRGTPTTASVDREPEYAFPRGLLVLLTVAAAVIAIAGIRSFSSVLGPIFLAMMIVIAVDPVMGWLIARRVHRVLAAILTLVVAYAVVVGLAVAMAIAVTQLAGLLPTYTGQFNELVANLEDQLAAWGVDEARLEEALNAVDWGQLVSIVQTVLRGLLSVFSDLIFILALMLFMVMDAATFNQRLDKAERARPSLIGALRGFASGTRRYLVVSSVFGAIVAVLDILALYFLSVPLPLLWGLLSFITNYIPNIGFIVGLIPPAALALLDGGVSTMIWVIVAYSAINFVIQSLIQPKFVGDAVGLSVTLTFLSLVFWSWVMGALGALLAIPLTLLTKALLIDIDPDVRWVNGLITSGAGPPDQESAAERTEQAVDETVERVTPGPATPEPVTSGPAGPAEPAASARAESGQPAASARAESGQPAPAQSEPSTRRS
jgi:predicted PurR-regulated permease PerM